MTSFKDRLVTGHRLLGTLISVPAPEIVELAASAGFDWLFLDMEHGAMDIRAAQHLLQTASGHIDCVIRCPHNDEVWIQKCLDIGASGVIIPQVKTAAEAEYAVRYSKYPPMGERSVGIARAQGYGMDFQPYVDSANDSTALILQIEHIDGVKNIDAILAVPGIDAIFIGPYDLSGSMGKIGDITSPDVVDAISTVRSACLTKQMPIGIFGAQPEAIQHYEKEGYRLLTVGVDAALLGNAYKTLISKLTL